MVASTGERKVAGVGCLVVVKAVQCHSFEHPWESIEVGFPRHISYLAHVIEDGEPVVERAGTMTIVLLFFFVHLVKCCDLL